MKTPHSVKTLALVAAFTLVATAGCSADGARENNTDAQSTMDSAATADMSVGEDGTEQNDTGQDDAGQDDAGQDVATELDGGVTDATTVGEEPYDAKLKLPQTMFAYANQPLPAHFKTETMGMHGQTALVDDDNTPAHNPITNAGATLGRVLFYDKNLSQNRTVACASCHKPEFGFSDDRVLSKGFDGGDTARHSMGLTQARYYRVKRFFWDQRAATLEDQVLMPFQDPVEMGMTLKTLAARANAAKYYPALFKAAFGDPKITTERMSLALAQFVRSMVSTGSKYDEGRAKVTSRSADFPNFTAEENLGKKLFVNPPTMGGKRCFTCHGGEGFVTMKATTNGLDADASKDKGYGEVTGQQSDMGTFKAPSLRNVALRAPYMHDGRFKDLAAVIDHYSSGIQPNPNLAPPLFISNGKATQLTMTATEKKAIIAFLKTLTDIKMTQDPKFSDPFVK
ncbi:MAG: cytochrome-c peroxidase [Myxococcales bacterium]|nr:cytochrome-c peroxidase [Myxococcales bacterium]